MSGVSGQRIVLITGANRGIGLETARQLGRLGHIVVLGAQDFRRGETAQLELAREGLEADVVQLDVTDSTSIRRARDQVGAKHGRLDSLVNNAGVFFDWGIPPSETPMDLMRRTFDTNFFGAWETTQAFLPLLRLSKAGRIVNVSSTAAAFSRVTDSQSEYDGNRVPAYQASKVALNAMTAQFARQLRGTSIKVNSVCPGYVNSGAPGTQYAAKSVQEGARVVVAFATLPPDGPSGGWFDDNGKIEW